MATGHQVCVEGTLCQYQPEGSDQECGTRIPGNENEGFMEEDTNDAVYSGKCHPGATSQP